MEPKSLKKWMLLITYTVLLVAVLLQSDAVLSFLSKFWGLLTPLLAGGAVAFVLKKPLDALCQGLRRLLPDKARGAATGLSLLLLYAGLLGGISLVTSFLLPQLLESVTQLRENLLPFYPKFIRWAESLQQQLGSWNVGYTDYYQLLSGLTERLSSLFMGLMPTLVVATGSAVRALTNLVLTLVFSIYFLLEKGRLADQLRRGVQAFFSPVHGRQFLHVLATCNEIFTHFIGGQLLEAVILGTLCTVGLLVLGFPYAMLVGVIIGLTSLIPIVGAFIGCAPAVFIYLILDPMQAVWFLVFIVVLQQLEGNLIYPKVVGGSIGLPALWILAAITVGGGLWGIVGMLLAVPITSVIYRLLGEGIAARLAKQNPPASAVGEEIGE